MVKKGSGGVAIRGKSNLSATKSPGPQVGFGSIPMVDLCFGWHKKTDN
jgi:hypothetical protein